MRIDGVTKPHAFQYKSNYSVTELETVACRLINALVRFYSHPAAHLYKVFRQDIPLIVNRSAVQSSRDIILSIHTQTPASVLGCLGFRGEESGSATKLIFNNNYQTTFSYPRRESNSF